MQRDLPSSHVSTVPLTQRKPSTSMPLRLLAKAHGLPTIDVENSEWANAMDRSRCVRAMSLGLAKSTPALTSPDSIAEYDPMPRRSRTPQYDVCASEPGLDELQSTDIVRDISLAVGESQIILQDNLCKPCAAWFEKHGPASYPGARPPVATHSRWRSHHTSFFELIKCCQTRASPKSAGPCVLCELFWCGIRSRLCQRRESRRRRPRLEESDLGSAMLEFDLRGETMASLITRSGGWLLTLTVFKAWDLQMGVMMESRREVPRNMCESIRLHIGMRLVRIHNPQNIALTSAHMVQRQSTSESTHKWQLPLVANFCPDTRLDEPVWRRASRVLR